MCDCEMPSVFNQTKPRARKRHRCCECRGWIEAGERYEYSWGIWDGDADSYKTCFGCAELREELGKLSKCCVPFMGVHEELQNLTSYEDGEDPKIAALMGRFDAIRIQRGAIISPAYQAEETEVTNEP